MSTLVTYKEIDGGDIQEVSPDPASPAFAGLALNTNFRALADSLPRNNYGASTNPTADNDSVDTAGIGVDFSPGSRWYNGTAIFECVNAAPTAAVWIHVNAGGGGWTGNATSALDMNGYALNMNTGGGSGGGTLNLDGGTIQVNGPRGVIGIFSGVTSSTNVGMGDVGNTSAGTMFTVDDNQLAFNYYCRYGGAIHLNGQVYLCLNDRGGSGGSTLFVDGGTVDFSTGGNINLDTTVGTQIGTAVNQMLAFYGATPIVQRSGAAQAAVATTTPTTGAYGFTSAQATAILTLLNELRAAMVAVGLIKGSA